MKTYKLSKNAAGMITYRYRAIYHDPSITCTYHLLAEVGDKYQAWFKREITRRGWDVYSATAPCPDPLGQLRPQSP